MRLFHSIQLLAKEPQIILSEILCGTSEAAVASGPNNQNNKSLG